MASKLIPTRMKKSFIILILIIYLIGCTPIQHDLKNVNFGIWKFSDVRLLDPVDSYDPNRDLIALYTRSNDKKIQIRIDFLELDFRFAGDIYIPIDIYPGGSDQIRTGNGGLILTDIAWDNLIIYSGSGKIQVVNSNYRSMDNIKYYISLNPIQDNIVLSFDKKVFPVINSLTKLQVLVTKINQNHVIDRSSPITLDAPSPTKAKVLFAFWNTFVASTPAETLRSWAGAHSGPTSSRHGLKYVIDSAANTKYPTFLFDLTKPEAISALDYIGVIDRINGLKRDDILFFIDQRTIRNEFDDDLFNEEIDSLDRSNYIFRDNDYAQLNIYICPLNLEILDSRGNNSFDISLECKSRFVHNGISEAPYPIILGGDFSNSVLGDPAILRYLISYINNHPWIQILSNYNLPSSLLKSINYQPIDSGDMPSFKNNFIQDIKTDNNHIVRDIYSALLDAPNNQISLLAWQIYISLLNPPSPELIPIAANYIGQIGFIIEAAKWVNKPFPMSVCEIDLDYDGDPECILANNNIFVTIEPNGAYIPFVFTKDEDGEHQIIGPTWEFIIGLGDPSTWDLSLGIRSDPGQILGAFVDDINNWQNSVMYINDKSVTFVNDNMSMRKSFSIIDNKIIVEFQDIHAMIKNQQIPLVLDPWTRYTKGWGDKYNNSTTSQGNLWEIKSGISVELISNNNIYIYPFNATHDQMAYPEDPNFDYGRGHYLPYPMALAEIHSLDKYSVEIVISP